MAYEKSAAAGQPSARGWSAYRDDQLLANPGGDRYHLAEGRVEAEGRSHSFMERLGKDLADAAANVGNFFKNMFFGAERHYRDEQNEIRSAKRRGLLGSVVDFAKDLGSALTLGLWRPDGEAAPTGFGERLLFAGRKLKEAVFGDVVGGIGGSVVEMGENLALAGLNLAETVPDATVGNFAAGEKAVSAVFDTAQVGVGYLADILPAGEAWQRVHATSLGKGRLPVLGNAAAAERDESDERWRYVRNTPFRKTLETVGALLVDIFTLAIFGRMASGSTGGKGHPPEP